MKRLTLMSVVALSLFLITGLAYAEEKFAYVDLGRVFDDYKKTKEYDKVLETGQKGYEKEREKKLDEVKKLQEKLSLLSQEERESRNSELQDKIKQLQEFDRNSTQDLRKQRDEKVQDIFKDIQKAIDEYAQKEKLTFVFDKRALVYDNKNFDITGQVLKILNR
jgi:outer membrane protein